MSAQQGHGDPTRACGVLGAGRVHATASGAHPHEEPLMNISRNALIAGAVTLALACGSAYAQSSGGNAGGTSGSAQGQAAQRHGGANAGTNGGNAGMNGGANGANGMRGTTEGCANQATTASQRVAEANRPPGSPVQGAASKGSSDWSDQANCANQQ